MSLTSDEINLIVCNDNSLRVIYKNGKIVRVSPLNFTRQAIGMVLKYDDFYLLEQAIDYSVVALLDESNRDNLKLILRGEYKKHRGKGNSSQAKKNSDMKSEKIWQRVNYFKGMNPKLKHYGKISDVNIFEKVGKEISMSSAGVRSAYKKIKAEASRSDKNMEGTGIGSLTVVAEMAFEIGRGDAAMNIMNDFIDAGLSTQEGIRKTCEILGIEGELCARYIKNKF